VRLEIVDFLQKIIPDNVTAGDYGNVTLGVAGNVSQLTPTGWPGRPTRPPGAYPRQTS
jgi:hypothetical protein